MTPRILDPVAVSRPQFSHRFEAYSPKLSRRITLFSWASVQLWTLLEAEPAVESFCERPGLISNEGEWRLADFWVRRDGQPEIWLIPDLVLTPVGHAHQIVGSQTGCLRNADPDFFAERAMLIRNWQIILPYVVSNRREISAAQRRRILQRCKRWQALVDIERVELPADPIVSRTTAFELTRRGELVAEDLHLRSLGPGSRFMAS